MYETILAIEDRRAPAAISRPTTISRLAQRWKNRRHSALPDWLPAAGTPGRSLTVLSASGVEHTIQRGCVVTFENGMIAWNGRRGGFGPIVLLEEWPS